MPANDDRRKVIRAKYLPNFTGSVIVGEKYAVIAGSPFDHVVAHENGINIQAGVGNSISFQTMSPQGPFHRAMPFPVTLLASVAAAPQELPDIPYMQMLPKLPIMGAALKCICEMGAATVAGGIA